MPVTSLRISSRVKPTASWAATLAIGKPVALEARAEERDTRGFISITTRRPVRGSTANWTLAPPVSIDGRSTVRPSSRISWYSRSNRVIWGATVTESPVWTPIGSTFSIEQTTGVVDPVAHHLRLELLPAEHRLLDQHPADRAGGQALGQQPAQLAGRPGDAAASRRG